MKILLVCLGNICRSPLAEGAFRQLAERHGLHWEIDSAGTADYHVGEAPDRRAQRAAAELGMSIADLRARQVNDVDFSDFDWILAMDAGNLRQLQERARKNPRARIGLLRDPFLEQSAPAEIADPYWGNMEDFLACATQIREAAEAFRKRVGDSDRL